MKTPKDILIELREVIPYRIDSCLDPYIEEAMEMYAKEYAEEALKELFTEEQMKESYEKGANTAADDILGRI